MYPRGSIEVNFIIFILDPVVSLFTLRVEVPLTPRRGYPRNQPLEPTSVSHQFSGMPMWSTSPTAPTRSLSTEPTQPS